MYQNWKCLYWFLNSGLVCYQRARRQWLYQTRYWSWWFQIQQVCYRTGSGRKKTSIWKPDSMILEVYKSFMAGKKAELKPSTIPTPSSGVMCNHLLKQFFTPLPTENTLKPVSCYCESSSLSAKEHQVVKACTVTSMPRHPQPCVWPPLLPCITQDITSSID